MLKTLPRRIQPHKRVSLAYEMISNGVSEKDIQESLQCIEAL